MIANFISFRGEAEQEEGQEENESTNPLPDFCLTNR